MKALSRILIASILFVSTGTVFSISYSGNELSTFKKVKPKPNYKFNQDTKALHFIDALCEYRVNNLHWDVIKQGEVKEKNVVLDLSELKSGEYIVEIEYQGYVFIEDIFL